MNYLAHLHLVPPTPADWVGALLPDFHRPSKHGTNHPVIDRGIRGHRKVDAWTDTHPIFHQTKHRLFAKHGRFSGILVDVFYDHVLASHWDEWCSQPLETFTDQVHAGLTAPNMQHWMPPTMRDPIKRLVEHNVLHKYATVDGIHQTLTRMSWYFSQRFKRPIDLAPATETLTDCLPGIVSDFRQFYPDLIERTQRFFETPCFPKRHPPNPR